MGNHKSQTNQKPKCETLESAELDITINLDNLLKSIEAEEKLNNKKRKIEENEQSDFEVDKTPTYHEDNVCSPPQDTCKMTSQNEFLDKEVTQISEPQPKVKKVGKIKVKKDLFTTAVKECFPDIEKNENKNQDVIHGEKKAPAQSECTELPIIREKHELPEPQTEEYFEVIEDSNILTMGTKKQRTEDIFDIYNNSLYEGDYLQHPTDEILSENSTTDPYSNTMVIVRDSEVVGKLKTKKRVEDIDSHEIFNPFRLVKTEKKNCSDNFEKFWSDLGLQPKLKISNLLDRSQK